MAKASKKKAEVPTPKKRGKYDDKLAVKGSFLDIINAAVEHREKKTAPKKKP